MSARFNLSSQMVITNSVHDRNEAYVEINLDIFDDSVAIHSIQGESLYEDAELCSLVKKALENESSSSSTSTFTSSSVGFSMFGNGSWNMKTVLEELKRQLVSLRKRPSASRRFHQSKSAAIHTLKGLKFFG